MSNIKPTLFGGKSLEQWEGEWRRLDGGIHGDHEVVRGEIGLFRLRRGKEVVYAGCSAAKSGPRLLKRLRVLAAPLQSGNDHYGAQMIREHGDPAELEVITLGKDRGKAGLSVALRDAMIAWYRPAWNLRRPRERKPRK